MYVALISALSLLTHEAKCCVLNAFVEFCTVSLLQRKIHKWMHWYTVIHIHTQIHRKYPLQFPVVKGWKDFWLSQLTNSLVYVLTFTLMQFKDSNFFFLLTWICRSAWFFSLPVYPFKLWKQTPLTSACPVVFVVWNGFLNPGFNLRIPQMVLATSVYNGSSVKSRWWKLIIFWAVPKISNRICDESWWIKFILS